MPWLQNRVYFVGFSTPEQSGKFKTLVTHTRLIKVDPPGGRMLMLAVCYSSTQSYSRIHVNLTILFYVYFLYRKT